MLIDLFYILLLLSFPLKNGALIVHLKPTSHRTEKGKTNSCSSRKERMKDICVQINKEINEKKSTRLDLWEINSLVFLLLFFLSLLCFNSAGLSLCLFF